jgi:phenylalanyl-tRNA synthetase alpha chain
MALLKKEDLPIRVFTIDRVFRPDVIDAKHFIEFEQCEGIVVSDGLNFRHLLGYLKEIAKIFGAKAVRFKPAYFPFTEPSVEGYVKLPNGRWLELLGAGLFRPEVLEIAGVDYPVGAWGLGVERFAAAYYGITDVRLLYARDYDFIRSFRLA